MTEVAQTQRRVTVAMAGAAVELCGDATHGPWSLADPVHIDRFPWCTGGLKQDTEVRLLYDASAIYVQFLCRDVHSSAQVRELNGPVCDDSCVELFASVAPQVGPDYFNLEINCCGTFLVGFGSGRQDRTHITPDLARRVSVATSVAGPTKEESGDDQCWWAAARMPLDVLSELAGGPVAPSPDGWRVNFYRCGGKSDAQYACWNDIVLPHPDFHCPDFFGRLTFA